MAFHSVYAVLIRDNKGTESEELFAVEKTLGDAIRKVRGLISLDRLEDWGMEQGEITFFYPDEDDMIIIQRHDIET